ncbi:unnamed protein product [Triticum turgidum subsp. durum]|uniref:Uncharacterized protein n=2 Tax=Triticum turgidum subsp. durum TaxID=4567 RepID=A0A9R1SAQ0_TRITD|nr:unnamed protein product [Triticum turgidum subsp. durum]
MEGACLCLLKSACQCLAREATSSAAKEMALQAGVQEDAMILAEELGEMHKFLADVDKYEEARGEMDPSGDAEEAPARRWVDKIRDMACDIQDCLLQLAPHRERPSLWRFRWTSLAPRHSIAAELKDLVSQVNRVSERRERYQVARFMAALRKPPVSLVEEARLATDIDHKFDLGQLLAWPDESLLVISVWTMAGIGNGDTTSLIGLVYDDAKMFQCRAWVTATHPISLTEFLRGLARQLLANENNCMPPVSQSTLGFLGDTERMGTEELMMVVANHLDEKRYLVIIEDVCARPTWDWIKILFPDHMNGSRIIVSSQRADVARHCAGRLSRSFTLEGVSDNDAQLYVSSNQAATTNEANVVIKIEPYSELVGRKAEVADLTRRILEDGPDCYPISVYGASGIGKSVLVKKVIYDSLEMSTRFEMLAWITMMRPFSQEEFLRSIISQFLACSPGGRQDSVSRTSNMSGDKLVTKILQLMEGGRSLVVLDGLSADEEWDQVKSCLWDDGNAKHSCTIVVTTTNAAVAHYCSGNKDTLCKLDPLDSAAVRQLFYHKVFKRDGLIELHKPMVDLADHIIKKCDGDLCAITIISGLLGTKTRTSEAWNSVLERYDSELRNKPDRVATAAAKLSYVDLPSHMKYLLQYISIFLRGYSITRRRLASAWMAEIYSKNIREDNAEELEKIFDGLVMRGILHPLKRAETTGGRVNVCQVDDLFQQLGGSEVKSGVSIHILDEHTVNRNSTISQPRHLVVKSGWIRHDDEFKKIDHSCARSLTVFGEWSSFFISPSMKLLRVLDLEDTAGLVEHHDLEQIGDFRHLKYLGLRNTGISHLPNSLGKLQGLEVLDIRGTYIAKLPSTIIHLTGLCHLRGGTMATSMEGNSQLDFSCEVTSCCPQPLQCAASSAFRMCLLHPFQRDKPHGVRVPKMIGKLKFITTLGTIDVTGNSRSAMKELQKLTQLQRLGLIGVTKHNSKHLCSTLERLQDLRSLMVHSGDSLGRLDTVSPPPHHLETLKLYGSLGTLPRWIKTLHNLQKLCLRTTLLDSDAVQIISKLPKLIMLRLLAKSIMVEEMEFQSDAFLKLELLQLDRLENLMSVSFPGGALPNLEILLVNNCNLLSGHVLRQFHKLPKIKKVLLDGSTDLDRNERAAAFKKHEEAKAEVIQKIRAQAHIIRAAFAFKEAAAAARN